jgi:hypothetical protein
LSEDDLSLVVRLIKGDSICSGEHSEGKRKTESTDADRSHGRSPAIG